MKREPLFSRSLTLVPRSFLLNRTETLATQASPSPSLVYRVNITTFFNLPDMSLMFRRYIRHLQIVLHNVKSPLNLNRARCYKIRYIALEILSTKKLTLSYLQGESQVYVFHMLVKVGFLPFFFSSSIPSMNKWYHFHIHTVVQNFASLLTAVNALTVC